MPALIAVIVFIFWSTSANAQEPATVAWWAAADFWKIAAPFFGAFLGFFGATFVNDWLHRKRADRERRESAIGLAVALKGEALAAADAYKRTLEILERNKKAWAFGPPNGLTEESEITITVEPEITSRIYVSNITRIELLGDPELIANITQFYSAASKEYNFKKVQGDDVYPACDSAARVAESGRVRAERIAEKLQGCADNIKKG